jgi:hypothetical protein
MSKSTSVDVTAKLDVRIDRHNGEVITLSAAEVRMAAFALRDSLQAWMPPEVPGPSYAVLERQMNKRREPLKSENGDDEE